MPPRSCRQTLEKGLWYGLEQGVLGPCFFGVRLDVPCPTPDLHRVSKAALGKPAHPSIYQDEALLAKQQLITLPRFMQLCPRELKVLQALAHSEICRYY